MTQLPEDRSERIISFQRKWRDSFHGYSWEARLSADSFRKTKTLKFSNELPIGSLPSELPFHFICSYFGCILIQREHILLTRMVSFISLREIYRFIRRFFNWSSLKVSLSMRQRLRRHLVSETGLKHFPSLRKRTGPFNDSMLCTHAVLLYSELTW